MFQRGRVYSLQIGDSSEALLIDSLQITFDIYKSSNNTQKSNSCAIEIYNLSNESLKILEKDFITCIFSVGYYETGVKPLFIGQVTQISTRKNGVDRVTQIQMGSGYVDLNHQVLNKVLPAGKSYKDAVEEVRKQMPGVVRGVYAGININNQIIYGYPLTGTPRDILDEITSSNNMEYRVDNNILYVNDVNGTSDTDRSLSPILTKESGLLEEPYYQSGDRKEKKKFRKPGIQFSALLNPDVKPGSFIQLKIDSDKDGWYKVDSCRYYGDYRGSDWTMEIFTSRGVEDA